MRLADEASAGLFLPVFPQIHIHFRTLIWSTSHLLADMLFEAISRRDFFLAGKSVNLLILSRTLILTYLFRKKEKEQNLLAG